MSSGQQIRALMRVLCLTLTGAVPAVAGPPAPPSPLPVTGSIVRVNTVQQLQNAVASIASNTTILIAPGTYQLTSPLYVNGSFTNVAIRGASGNRDDVVLVGRGMTVDGGVPFGIWTGGNVHGVTIANLTIRDVLSSDHPQRRYAVPTHSQRAAGECGPAVLQGESRRRRRRCGQRHRRVLGDGIRHDEP